MAEVVETAQETVAYEPDKDEKVTDIVSKKALKALIDDLKDTPGTSARLELDELKKLDAAIKKIENNIKVNHRPSKATMVLMRPFTSHLTIFVAGNNLIKSSRAQTPFI